MEHAGGSGGVLKEAQNKKAARCRANLPLLCYCFVDEVTRVANGSFGAGSEDEWK